MNVSKKTHPSFSRRIGRIVAWFVAVLAILVAILTVFILTFDWNRARPWVNEKVSEAIGRPFAIEGDLKVGLRHSTGETGWRAWVPWPRFSASNITIANPDWTKQPHFATLDEINFQVKVLPLIAHDIVIPAIHLVNPSVDVERLIDGRNNWTFKLKSSAGPTEWRLDLHDIAFDKGRISVSDEQKKVDMQIIVDTLGKPIPIGEALQQQQAKSRSASAREVGKAGAHQFERQAEAAEASAASTASGTGAALLPRAQGGADAVASGASTVVVAPGPASAGSGAVANERTGAGGVASGTSGASGAPSATGPRRQVIAPYAIGWSVKGTYNKTPVSGDGKVGGVLALQDPDRPFPVQADVQAGDLHVALVGTLTDPAHLAAVDLRLWLRGTSLDHLYGLTGITLPQTPPYATEGHLIGQFNASGNTFTYEKFTGRVGGSDLNGTLTYVGRKPRPLLQGELVSNTLRFADLAPIIGADSNRSKAERGDAVKQPSDKVLPVEPFHTDRWKAIDADVKLTGRRIIKDPSLPITDLYTHVVMKDGVLTLEPLKFGVAGGALASNITLDGSSTPLKGRFSTSARHVKLKQLFPKVKTMQSALGEINGDAALSATGNSPAALAGTSNGEVKLLVTDGTVSLLLMEAAGLNVANVIYEKLFGTRDVKINCAAADFVVTDGVLDSRVFALDTADAVINIDGQVNLRDETFDLGIHPHTKGFRIFTLRSPLYAKGTFKDPHVGVNAAALALRGGAMVGLGLINPFAALLPLIAPSNNKPLPCGELLANMRAKPSAPPPGHKERAKGSLLTPDNSPASAASASKGKAPASQKPKTRSPENAAEYKGS